MTLITEQNTQIMQKSTLPYNFKHYLLRFALFLLCYLLLSTLVRFGFYLKFSTDTARAAQEIWQAFILGMRFDFSVFCYVFLLPVLIQLASGLYPSPAWLKIAIEKTLSIYFWCAFFVVFSLMAIDFGFYAYFQDRINILIFGFFQDDTDRKSVV